MASKTIKPGTIFAGDFETLTASPTRVWCWQVRDVATSVVHSQGTDIQGFVDNAPAKLIYFHNLSFDAAFLIDYLLTVANYQWTVLDQSPEGKSKGLHKLNPGQVTGLIGDMGQHYSVSYYGPNGVVEMHDSLKKVQGTLRDLGVAYGADVLKGTTPLYETLPVGYEPTQEEWDYLSNDTMILAHVLQKLYEEGYTSMTIAGDCFRDWSTMFHKKFGDADLDKNRMDTFRRLFPLLDRKTDTDVRKGYRGGWTYTNPKMQGRVITGGGVVYDVNSMYPGVMVQEDFPVGRPLPIKPGGVSRETHPLEIRGAMVSYTLKEGHLPCIPMSTESFGGSGWSSEADEVELWATGREWELIKEQYDIDIEEELGGWAFRAMSGAEMFGEYIEHYMTIKANTKGPKRLLAKLSLNNIWGRFGLQPLRGQRVPTVVNGEVQMLATPKTFDDPVYTPVATFTTAYARERIVRAAQANYDRFCYADTDSLHLTGFDAPVGLEVHDSKLGAWAHEGSWSEAIYCRAKAYCERMLEEAEGLLLDPITGKRNIAVAMAGLPAEAREGLAPELIHDGMVFDGKKARKRVPGGIILSEIAWRLDYSHGVFRM